MIVVETADKKETDDTIHVLVRRWTVLTAGGDETPTKKIVTK